MNEMMTVGELAKRMDTTVRTLQYYDKQGLLIPSGETVGGRRLYSDADLVHLHQIQMLKGLGFSLEDIRERLREIETPEEMVAVLDSQAGSLRAQIDQLTEAYEAVKVLREETLRMKRVDFRRYAAIVQMMKMNFEEYWLISQVGDKMLDRIEEMATESDDFTTGDVDWRNLNDTAARLTREGVSPTSDEGQAFAAEYWQMVQNFTKGDASMLSEMNDFAKTSAEWTDEFKGSWDQAEGFIGEALTAYFQTNNIDFPEN